MIDQKCVPGSCLILELRANPQGEIATSMAVNGFTHLNKRQREQKATLWAALAGHNRRRHSLAQESPNAPSVCNCGCVGDGGGVSMSISAHGKALERRKRGRFGKMLCNGTKAN